MGAPSWQRVASAKTGSPASSANCAAYSWVSLGGAALKSLYLDKISGVITEGQFAELNQSFLEEKKRMERRLAQVGRELGEQPGPEDKEALLVQARELLKLETVPRELVTLLVEKVEVGEKDPKTGRQEVRITWKF